MKKKSVKDLSPSKIEDLLFHALRSIYLFERAEIEQFDLDYQQMYLLKVLRRMSPLRVSDIAEELRIPVFSTTRLVNQLESKTLVIKNRDIKDRRNIFVQITAEGRELVKKIESHIIELILTGLKTYSEEEARLIIEVVKNLDRILGLRQELKEAAYSG
ncbi:MAG TPA: MarR family transcriptional regulator [Spirochaetota bacterium]|nr:MarR family transcriptional regulator [Spirochaetota bacterium]HPC42405.1 MarR family transcriptional regulator [Spirochaetota bacterium]HPL16669.1 MarR family transcriptional regulator [Spirochaetota bacterium]HQF06608.1 MarR family transcriptional regulator [Spirochaetota bacterium]HQH95989.1 MarR family transcriptional regulator [Spirochaetota bacterium]